MSLRSVFRKVMDAIQGPPHIAGQPTGTDRLYEGKTGVGANTAIPTPDRHISKSGPKEPE